ncbi:TetR/AcrR family transcriptional regulator [Paenibacillus provencensis]|uniref:TetR/AcrR family transcriptional regulator n=1 Tax=Paenibacillus provencensis TaxID=441151 RepID=A0ABW3PMG7_9BACL|nr:TetR/AcrR family transcriptional regulator [Paenibacillus sp. MER 78]MCM3129513.1 TetR/AcrR family transcriptional regulator [Paenibacillus sp. MER 78]
MSLAKDDQGKNKNVKEQILKAAKKLFSSQGYEATTVRQICEEAGVSLALVSYHFGGKEKVFFALFDPIRETTRNHLYDLSKPLAALTDFCRSFVLFRYEEHELITILQQELFLKSPRLDLMTDVFLPSWNELRQILTACKENGIVEYESLEMTINFVMGTLIFSLSNPFLNPIVKNYSPEEASEQAIGYILKGIRINKGTQ